MGEVHLVLHDSVTRMQLEALALAQHWEWLSLVEPGPEQPFERIWYDLSVETEIHYSEDVRLLMDYLLLIAAVTAAHEFRFFAEFPPLRIIRDEKAESIGAQATST